MKRKDWEPNKKYYKDDHWRRAQDIVSMFPPDIQADIRSENDRYVNRGKNTRYRDRYIRTDFSPEEKAKILSRVAFVGVERAAFEAGTSKEIVSQWLRLIDQNISETNSEWENFEIEEDSCEESCVDNVDHVSESEKSSQLEKSSQTQIDQNNIDSNTTEETEGTGIHRVSQKKIERENFVGQKNAGSGSPYSPWRQVPAKDVIAYANKVGDKKAMLEFGINAATMNSLRKETPKFVGVRRFTTPEKTATLNRADQVGIKQTSIEFNVSPTTISVWRKKFGRSKHNSHTLEEKSAILDRADEIGAKKAAIEFKVTDSMIRHWRKKMGRTKNKKRTLEEKLAVIDRADEIGNEKAAAELNVNVSTISQWRKETGRAMLKIYSVEEKAVIMARANEIGVKKAALEFGINYQTLIIWRRKSRGFTRKLHNAEERLVIWTRANEVGRKQAAFEFGMSPTTIENWSWKYGMKTPPLYGPNDLNRPKRGKKKKCENADVLSTDPISASEHIVDIVDTALRTIQDSHQDSQDSAVGSAVSESIPRNDIEEKKIILTQKVEALTRQLEELRLEIMRLN